MTAGSGDVAATTGPMPPAPQAEDVAGAPWRRLDPRMIVVRPLHDAIGLLPVLAIYLFVGNTDEWKLVGSCAAIAALALYGLVSWLVTRYRVTPEQVQLHTGLLSRKQLAVRTERIRTVETTAKFGHRLFGLEAVRIGTGQQASAADDGLRLDAVTRQEARELRLALLRRREQRAAGENRAGSAPAGTRDGAAAEPIATLDWSWLRYAPLTLTGLAAVAAAFGVAFRVGNDLEVNEAGAIRWLLDRASVTSVVVAAVALLLVVAVGGVVGYALQFWDYRLTREPDRTVRVRRGLLSRRSITIEEAKLRGVRVREPLLLRLASGARTDVISTGMGKKEDSALLVPPAPLAAAGRISADVLHADAPPTAVPLRRHPGAALRRRLVRALSTALLVVAALALAAASGWLPQWPWQASLVLLPLAALLGWDRYRSLGHALNARYLVCRSGSLPRDTAALQRSGIIGWQVRRSLFQRRSGLISLVATSAAGAGAYEVTDIGEADGLALADATTPGMLSPFLER